MSDHITSAAVTAIYRHEIIGRKAFQLLVKKALGGTKQKGACIRGGYRYVEYFNSPHGLIVYAHRTDDQVDGIHPANLSHSIRSFRNIIEPLCDSEQEGAQFNVHYMTRRSQGGLILSAFGRMIDGGDPEAPSFMTDTSSWLKAFATPEGPLVGIFEGADTVYVIRPVAGRVDAREAA